MLTGVTVKKSKYQYYSEGMDLSELILLVLMSSLFLDRMILNKKMVQLDFRIKIEEEGEGGGGGRVTVKSSLFKTQKHRMFFHSSYSH